MDFDLHRTFSLKSTFHYLILLLIAKFFKSFGIYLCYDLLKTTSIVNLLLILNIITTVVYVALQNNPLNRSKLTKSQFYSLIKYCLAGTLVKLLWLFGLSLCGPLRAVLIFEQTPQIVLNAFKTLFGLNTSESSIKRSRGVLLLIIGTLILFVFDKDKYNLDDQLHPEGSHHGFIAHAFYFFIDSFNLTDHKGGIMLLIGALFGQILINNTLSVHIQAEIQPKRLQALTSLVSSVIMIPIVILTYICDSLLGMSSNAINENEHSIIFILFQLVLAAIFVFIINFYIEFYVSHKTSPLYAAKYGQMLIFLISLALSYLWSHHPHVIKVLVGDKVKTIVEEEHAISLGVFLVVVLFVFATQLLSSPIKRTQGSFIGYSSNGQPLYSLTGDSLKRTSQSLINIMKNIFKEIISHSDSRSIFYFLCINLSFTFVELIYGAWTNSLGLISDGFHMFFDCSALVMGLCASVISHWKPTRIYSYGYGRIEVLSGFINGLFLIVIALFVFIESVLRLFEPPEIKTEKLLFVSFGGLFVNLIGIFAFTHAHTHGGAPCSSSTPESKSHGHTHSHDTDHHDHNHQHTHSHSHSQTSSTTDNDNMRGVYLHVLADTMGSVGVIISSFLVQQFGWFIADPLCSMFIAIMIFLSVRPLIKHSAMVLMLRTPKDKEPNFKQALTRILNIEGVISYRDDHLWQLSSSSYVTTLHVLIEQNSYEQLIGSQIQNILKELKISNVTIQLEKEVFFQHLMGLGVNSSDISDRRRKYHSNQKSLMPTIDNSQKFI